MSVEFAFPHSLYYSSRTCGLHRDAPSRASSRRNCLTSIQLSKNSFPTPGGGLIGFGTASATNKKTGVERRASPSILDRLARSSNCFYPVLMINGTSNGKRSVLNSRRPPNALDCRHQRSIPVFPGSSSPFIFYFSGCCGNQERP